MKYILLYKDLKKILIVNDLKVVKEEFYCWYLCLYLKIIGDPKYINETDETINMLIVSAIEQLKKSKRSGEHTILNHYKTKEMTYPPLKMASY